ncbi:hypothetical protein SAMN05428976_11014 [Clostridium sp. USBA 49]|uniref:hypothetical protein n=1 Tax=Clostridium sp. USBA 49 TaxID=1881060 RepID=UPI00099B1C06|nr:hypothetical protein [Clostridium sp. USBA 49]SKA87538.1 hypothetical protein SAMN05428976_11014 [Clostridium sp. USBA 49]
MIEIYNNSKIFVACPAKQTTGGPELLHQLVYKLNKLGYNAYVFYYGDFKGDPVPDEYKKYKTLYVSKIEDLKENLLIVPETNTGLLFKYKNIRKSIWWLSVDNYFESIKNMKIGFKNKIKLLLGLNKYFDLDNSNNIYHLAQSEYALNFLKNKNLTNIYYLSDFLNKDFLDKNVNLNISEKENIVAYNPKKGFEFTKMLIENGPDIRWEPIVNMKRDEVINLLRKSKVYIDFGNHPGKDRIPREAAICGCCVITGKKGSARFYNDVPIDDSFKFEDSPSNLEKIIYKIKECFSNYQEETRKFDKYREIIKKSESEFEKDIIKIFKKI